MLEHLSILKKGLRDYTCNKCRETIPHKELSMSLGLSWGRGSRGRICMDCLIKLGKELEVYKYDRR